MTSVITNTLPSTQTNSKSIFTIRKMVLADKDIQGSFVGEPTYPQIRIGALEVRLFTYEGTHPQYQLILTNFNGKLIWFSKEAPTPVPGWYTITNLLSQRSMVDYLLNHPNIHECIEELVCVVQTPQTPVPNSYMGSGSANRPTFTGKAYCGDAIRRKIDKWI